MITSNTIIATVTHTPTEDGATVTITITETGAVIIEDIIPPEGNGADCWLGTRLDQWLNRMEALDERLDSIGSLLADWAFGPSGTFHVVADGFGDVRAV